MTHRAVAPAIVFLLLATALLFAAAPAAQADTGIVGWIGSEAEGGAAGQLAQPGGLAVNATGAGGASAGDLYVADRRNNRIDEFSSSSAFVRAFGYDVVGSGKDNSSVNAEYELKIVATGGTFVIAELAPDSTLTRAHTSPLPFGASPLEIQAALEALPGIGAGDVSVSGGPGDAGGTRPYRITLIGALAGDDPEVPLQFEAGGLVGGPVGASSLERTLIGGAPEICNANPPSNDICKAGSFGRGTEFEVGGSLSELGEGNLAVSQSSGDVYAAVGNGISQFSATGHFIRAFGFDVVRSGPDNSNVSPEYRLTIAATGGTFQISFAEHQTPPLSYEASAQEVQAALESLPLIGAGDISVSGGPGDSTGSHPYNIVFGGASHGNELVGYGFAADGSELQGASPEALLEQTQEGGAFEICQAAKGDVCKYASAQASAGALAAPRALAVAPPGAANQGDLLVADSGNNRVDEFTPAGTFVRAFGTEVVASGPDKTGAFDECIAANGDTCAAGSSGEAVGQFSGNGPVSITEDPTGAIYTAEDSAGFRVQKFTPQPGPPALSPALFGTLGAPDGEAEADSPHTVAIGPSGSLLVAKGFLEGATVSCPDGNPSPPELRIQELSPDGSTLLETDASCNGVNAQFVPGGLAFDPTTDAIYLSSYYGNEHSSPQRVLIIGPGVTPPSITPESVTPNTAGATLTATIDPNSPTDHPNPPTTSYHFEYKLASAPTWTQFGGEVQLGAGISAVPVTVHLGGLEGNQFYEGRFVATKQFGEGVVTSAPKAFTTLPVPPSIDGLSSSNVTTTTAVLHAKVNPDGAETTCLFEYGPTTSYGHTASCEPVADIGSAHTAQPVEAHLTGLAEGVTYHFRLLATNASGTTESEDQSFEFLPPNCPNSAVRQQTHSNYLPDCRAYELVSPQNANATLLYSGGPNTGRATSPSRFAFVGAFSSLPGTEPIDTAGDLYVATRTDTGWVSHYIGLPGSEAGCMGGPPNDPWSHLGAEPSQIQNKVPADPSMSHFLDFLDGSPVLCKAVPQALGDASGGLAPESNAPYLWSAEGSLLGRLPADSPTVPGAAAALECSPGSITGVGTCSSEVAASGDLTHFVFSTRQLSFEGGLTEAPGSAYDDDLATGKITLISRLPGGEDIPQDPTFASTPPERLEGLPGGKEEFLRFPAVSADGSHILISTATAGTPACGGAASCQRFIDTPVHLYISIDDALTKEVSVNQQTGENVGVNYVGTAEDGAKVFFTSKEQLIEEDKDHSTDLYMWSEKGEEEGHPLTLLSKGENPGQGEPGNTDACHPALELTAREVGGNQVEEEFPWTTGCGVVPYSGWSYANARAGLGGNGISDTAIASQNGDIYFYSPELLDGDKGIEGQQNLYDYREGRPQFVATFAPGRTCVVNGFGVNDVPSSGLLCSNGPIARIDVSPDDAHMALVTADRLTAYDNTDPNGSCQATTQGVPTGETHCTEMYSYTTATGAIVCDSCNPSGAPPSTQVSASQNGLFMTDDGRTFFSTSESLVPQDTNEGEDVYEFVDGRPHLITTGTGITSSKGFNQTALQEVPGLVGVSANGTDVYLSTFNTLVSEDHNGNFFKFYDARTNGGFPQPPPNQPCEAAEECHGPGTEAPTAPQITSNGAPTNADNVTPRSYRRHGKKHRHRPTSKPHRKRQAKARRRGRR